MKQPQTKAPGQPDYSPTAPRRDRRRAWPPPTLHRLRVKTDTSTGAATGLYFSTLS